MARKNLLKGFKRPQGITSDNTVNTKDYGQFVAYPFESAGKRSISALDTGKH